MDKVNKIRRVFDRQAMKQELLSRVKEAYEKKDSYGRFGSYIKEEYQDRLWKCNEGEHVIDIIPYIAGPNHPTLKEGEVGFLLDFYVHSGIGPNEDRFVCLSRTYNKPCPICEDQRKKRREGTLSDEELAKLNPQRRTLYNIIVWDNDKEIEKGVQLWDVSQRYMDRELAIRSRNSRTGEFINYAHPDKDIGKSIYFVRKGMGQYNTEFLGHSFVDREESISDEHLAQALPLDQVIHIPTYEEVYRAHFGEEPPSEKIEKSDIGKTPKLTNRLKPELEIEKKIEVGRGICPAGGTMGVDIDSLPECKDCDVWDECQDLERELQTKKTSSTSQLRFKFSDYQDSEEEIEEVNKERIQRMRRRGR